MILLISVVLMDASLPVNLKNILRDFYNYSYSELCRCLYFMFLMLYHRTVSSVFCDYEI
jgi:hypothetical protein